MSKSSPPPPTTQKDEERRLYEREYASVRPLPPGPTRIPRIPGAGRSHGEATQRARPTDREGLTLQRSHGLVTGVAFGVSRETVRALSRGELPVEGTCDLHGTRAEPARARLERFIAESARQGRRTLLIICGRGLHSGPAGPALLEVAIEVLTSPRRHVLAFTSAPSHQGGEGAILVLLRKS